MTFGRFLINMILNLGRSSVAEQGILNPKVGGSFPLGLTKTYKMSYRPYTVVWVGISSQALKNVGVSSLEEIHKIFVKAAENLDELDTDDDDSCWFSDYIPIVVEDNDGYKLGWEYSFQSKITE